MLTMLDSIQQQIDEKSFASLATQVMSELQNASRQLLAALPEPIDRAVDLERSLGLDKKLSWQIFKIARATPYPMAEGLNIPTRPSIRRLILAATKKNVPASVTDEFSRAFESFEEFVTRHAGDRETFSSMLASLLGNVGHDVMEKHRTTMFRACSHVWGLKVDAVVRCEIFHPSARVEGSMDIATITGLVNLHRLRYGSPVAITVGAAGRGDASQTEAGGKYTLGVEERPVLINEFSDEAVGSVAWVPHAHLPGHSQLQLNDLGRSAAASFFTLQLTRAREDRPRPDFENGAAISTPMKVLVCDLMVPSGYSDPATAMVTERGSRAEFPTWEVRSCDLLPQTQHVTTFASQSSAPDAPEIPNYSEAVSHVLRKLGWDSTCFDVYRCRVVYPFFHTIVRVSADPLTD